MLTLIMQIEYDGTDFYGWQMQKNTRTVQGVLLKNLKKIFDLEDNIVGSGRTDTGVHSSGQIAHCVLKRMPSIPEHKFVLGINSFLPPDVKVCKAIISEIPFHARFDAIAREYKYNLHLEQSVFHRRFSTFYKYPINAKNLFSSAELFLGSHDFTTFSKRNESTTNHVCDVQKCYWEEFGNGNFQLTIKANRFVYGMVRFLVGAMLDVAREKRSAENIYRALEAKDRVLNSNSVPAQGLNLYKIYYPDDINRLIYGDAELNRK
jgi:tRNA pseudouridine38-40 synthase